MEIKFLNCPLCTVSHFQNVVVLRNALIDVTKKPLTCPVCEEVLIGLDKFTIHLFTHTNLIINDNADVNKNVSNETNDNNNNKNVNYIITTNNSPIDNCLQLQPQLIIDNVSTKDTLCEICNINFTDKNMLDMHRNLLHSNGYSCHLCQKKFKMHGSLMVHMRVAHFGFKNKLFTQENLQNNNVQPVFVTTIIPNNELDNSTQKPFDNKQWECDVCLKKFTTKYFLKKHKRLHTGEMPYECTLCNKSFTFQQSYHKHMLYHSTDKPHVCNECGRAFKELSTLHNHQRIHSGERPFGCETCGKRFRQRVSYLVHKRIHTGAMPYKCTACEKNFRYKVSQRTHKCKAQPPGSVVRQFGDLVQKLLQNHSLEEPTASTSTTSGNNQESTSEKLSEQISSKSSTIQPPIQTTIESQNTTETQPAQQEVNTDFFGLILSPTFQITSEQFESLCLTSKENDNHSDEMFNNLRQDLNPSINNIRIEACSSTNLNSSSSSLNHSIPRQECSTINEECFKQLLYSNPN